MFRSSIMKYNYRTNCNKALRFDKMHYTVSLFVGMSLGKFLEK